MCFVRMTLLLAREGSAFRDAGGIPLIQNGATDLGLGGAHGILTHRISAASLLD